MFWSSNGEIEAGIQGELDIYRAKIGPSHLFHSSPKTQKHSREQYFIEKNFLIVSGIYLSRTKANVYGNQSMNHFAKEKLSWATW